MQAITLVYVHHEDPTPNITHVASVWISMGERECPSELPSEANGWFKIVGPIEGKTADEICSSLETFLSQNGFQVKEQMIAD